VTSARGDDRTVAAAHAEILARLWGAFAREPLPGIKGRRIGRGTLTVRLGDGTTLAGDAAAARPFAAPGRGLAIAVTGPGGGGPREISEPGDLVRALAPNLGRHAGRLAAELDNSVANLALARAAQPAADGGAPMLERAAATPDPLAWLEESVVDGHPLHPCCRTRIGLDSQQVRAYAPEHRPIVALRQVTVPADRWYGVHCGPVLLLHPFQHDRLLADQPWLAGVDREVAARPLMSLRTLALVADPGRHVKTAVDIQMTSAVRTVSAASIHNGQALSALLHRLRPRAPGMLAVTDLGGGAVLVGGEPDRRLAMAVRQVPPLTGGEVALPLATLAAPTRATGAPLVTELVEQGYRGDPLAFVDALATVLLPPVLGLLALGVALEAHGQNVLGVVRDGRLVRLLYRDFGGVRVSAERLQAHGIEPPQLRGDVPTDDPEVLHTKVSASAVSTVLGETIAVLGRTTDLDEELAWRRVAAVARALPGPDAAHLFAATLPVKAMTAMRLADHPTDDLWCAVPNAMAGLR
jgi:siderophore synthetase component